MMTKVVASKEKRKRSECLESVRGEGVYHVLAGTCGGMASILVCHPLDTVRTRLQTSIPPRVYQNAWSCAKATIRNEGVRGLYRGLWWPLGAQGIFKAIMFGVYGNSRRTFGDSWLVVALCGALAGGVNAIVLTPIELIRNRQQISSATVSGFQICKHVMKKYGILTGLWRGFAATLCRDVPGVAAYYLSFEFCRRRFSTSTKVPSNHLSHLALSGALGGVAFWLIALPFDHVKSRIQVSDERTSFSMFSILRNTPISQLYLGFGSAIARGVPGSAIVFVVYARVFDFFEKRL